MNKSANHQLHTHFNRSSIYWVRCCRRHFLHNNKKNIHIILFSTVFVCWAHHIKVALKWHNQTCSFRSLSLSLGIRNSTWKKKTSIDSWSVIKYRKTYHFLDPYLKPTELNVNDVRYWSYFSKDRRKKKTEWDWRVCIIHTYYMEYGHDK